MVTTGIPCPTCGMTTAFSHCVRGHWLTSFIVQPAGCLVAVATMLALIMSVILMFAALTVDVGMLYSTRNDLQNSADAGALGGTAVLMDQNRIKGSYSRIMTNIGLAKLHGLKVMQA